MTAREIIGRSRRFQFCQQLGALLLVFSLFLAWPAAGRGEDKAPEAEGPEEASPEPERTLRPLIRSGMDGDSLARQYPERLVWLEPEDLPPVPALYQPGKRSPERGAILLIADEGQSAGSGLLAALQERLSEAGWAVLAVGVTAAPDSVVEQRRRSSGPERPAEDPDDENGSLASVMIDLNSETAGGLSGHYYRDQARRQVTALRWLRAEGHEQPVIVALGWSAELVNYGLEHLFSEVTRLVWVAPRFSRGKTSALASGVRDLQILDLYTASGGTEQGARRTALFRGQGVEGYQPSRVAIAERPEARDAPVIAGRILGWLMGQR